MRAAQATALLLIFVVVYLPVAGLGFISDDYAWTRHGRLGGAEDVARIFTTSVGFYRPLVSLSFGATHAMVGLSPRWFGLTNLALALLCAAGVWRLAREFRLTAGAALVAAGVWAFNFHGINMAVLWLSGRTSLLLAGGALWAAIAFRRGRTMATLLGTSVALLSKEEAVTLPLLFTLWAVLDQRDGAPAGLGGRLWQAVARTAWLWAALAVYLALRAHSEAFWPFDAPPYYAPVSEVRHALDNALEYADRSLTFATLAVLGTALLVRRRPTLSAGDHDVLFHAAAWFVCGFALTLFLPVRSSLYVVFPTVGSALAAAVVVAAMTRHLEAGRLARNGWIGIVLLAALVPVYASRTTRWTELARLSSAVTTDIREAHLPPGTTLLIEDDRRHRANLRNAWAGLVADVAALEFGGRLTLVVADEETPDDCCPGAVRVRLEDGRLSGLPHPQE